jgi:hypothetical protein
MRRAETVVALILTVGAALLVREAHRLPVGWAGSGPGAGFFPFWLAVGVGICAALIFLRSLRAPTPDNTEAFIPPTAWKPLLIALLPMAAMIGLVNYLGIYLGGALYLAGYMRFVGRHRPAAIVLVSVLLPLSLFLIFERWFILPMPKGSILEYFLYGR